MEEKQEVVESTELLQYEQKHELSSNVFSPILLELS